MTTDNLFILLLICRINIVHTFIRPCNASLQTVQRVSECPTDLTSYNAAVKRKNCTAFAKDAGSCDSFLYHCVLSEDVTHLVEVCAPSLNIIGHVCARFNTNLKSIIRIDGMTCEDSLNACPYSYHSTNAYQYPQCYANLSSSQPPTTEKPQSNENQTCPELERKDDQVPLYATLAVVFTAIVILATEAIIYGVWRCHREKARTMENPEAERFEMVSLVQADRTEESRNEVSEQPENSTEQSRNEVLVQQESNGGDERTQELLPSGSIGQAQAWSHYTGFLHYVLPQIHLMIESTELYRSNMDRFPLLMYELVPESCECKVIEDIPKEDKNPRITLMEEKTGKIQYSHAGNTRNVELPIYRVTDRDKTDYFCVLETPFVLAGIKKMMKKTPLHGMDLQMKVKDFSHTLDRILYHRDLRNTYNKARVIAYNGEQSGFVLADEILRAVKQDLHSNRLPPLPAGDVAPVLAWGYAVNYLARVMPGLTNVITKNLKDLNKPLQSCPKKLYLIIPKSCDISKSLEKSDRKISLVTTMQETYFGISGRSYTFDMYTLEYGGKDYLFVGQYPAPIACLRGMFDLKVTGITDQELTSQVEKFSQEITKVLKHEISAHFSNQCETVFYDDTKKTLSEEMAKRLIS